MTFNKENNEPVLITDHATRNSAQASGEWIWVDGDTVVSVEDHC